jgi:hypothetical protein
MTFSKGPPLVSQDDPLTNGIGTELTDVKYPELDVEEVPAGP